MGNCTQNQGLLGRTQVSGPIQPAGQLEASTAIHRAGAASSELRSNRWPSLVCPLCLPNDKLWGCASVSPPVVISSCPASSHGLCLHRNTQNPPQAPSKPPFHQSWVCKHPPTEQGARAERIFTPPHCREDTTPHPGF